ncbi:rhodanese-like domain-containing protein [Streptosporangium roseum]|uniref:rhodanese-like domain-containing protein n=1 Tax=Streptosporangium roseum TaxID=2001 RepID=UPI00331C4A6F
MIAGHLPSTVTFDVIERWRAEKQPHALLDVRERGEYALGQIPGGCPLPRGLIEIVLPRLVPWQDTPLVLYSNDEHRSGLAARTCLRLGYRNVSILEGGLRRWAEAGRTPLHGVSVTGKTFAERLSITGQVQQLTTEEVAGLDGDGGALIIDIRTAGEYLNGHVPGARNVPAGELVSSLFAAGLDHTARSAPIIVHCAGRTRSIIGAYLLERAGFGDVFALRNGTMAWMMSGRELETGPRPWIAPAADPAGVVRAAEFASSFVGDSHAARIDGPEVAAMAGRACYVIDVRSAEEYTAGHIAGALSCPAGQLANALEEQIAVRDALLVCYSNDETRARIGAGLLSRIGYHRVAWLAGGLDRWTGSVVAGGPNAYLDDLTFTGSDVRTIDRGGLAARLREGVGVVIDVRRSSEYALSHIPGSVWVPRGNLERRISAYASSGTGLVVVSDRELRSALAARTLLDLGYPDVAILQDGLNGWIASGGPAEDGLDGADVSLTEAKEEVELLARRARVLERDREDMIRYLDWEERLGTES